MTTKITQNYINTIQALEINITVAMSQYVQTGEVNYLVEASAAQDEINEMRK